MSSTPMGAVGTIRVLHVIDAMSGGGAEASLQALLPRLDAHGVTTAVATLKPCARGSIPRAIAIDAPRHRLGRLEAIQHVRRVIAKRRPDLVHVSLFEAGVAGRVAASMAGVPALVSFTAAHYDVPELRTGSGWRDRAAMAVDGLLHRHATTAFHAVSEAAAASAARAFGLDLARIRVVGRGRDPAPYRPPLAPDRSTARRQLGLPPNSTVVVTVGREQPPKGHLDLVAAFVEVAGTRSDLRLVMAGSPGASTPAIEARIARSEIAHRVHRLGFRDDVPLVLAVADLFVLPSRSEGSPGALMEAMAAGVPVVATDAPAVVDVLDGGRCGLLAPRGDPKALADAIAATLTDETAARRRVAAASARFESCYHVDRMVEGMASLYRTVLDHG